jgi:pimeloyl-ACP methyl ester carboxylesterase
MTYRAVRIPRIDYLSIRGLRHRVLHWEGSGATPIVLLHGFMDCADTWQFLVDSLPADWSLAAPDWRGFGDSQWAPGGYWFPDYLADLEELLARLSPGEPASVIGHSMGANVATLYAGVRPARLRWLINLEGIGLSPTQPAQAPTRYAQWLDEQQQPPANSRYPAAQQLAELLIRRNPRLPAGRADFIARAWTRPVSEGAGVQLAFDPAHRQVNPVLYRREEAAACWERVTIPMLLLLGAASAHGKHRREHFGDELVRRLFRDVEIRTLPDVGHMMHHEDPLAVAGAITDFIRRRA